MAKKIKGVGVPTPFVYLYFGTFAGITALALCSLVIPCARRGALDKNSAREFIFVICCWLRGLLHSLFARW